MSAPQGWTGNADADLALILLDRLDDTGEGNAARIEQLEGLVRRLAAAAPAPVNAAIWEWLTADGESICERWQAILERWDGSDGRVGIEAAAVAAMQASGIGGKA